MIDLASGEKQREDFEQLWYTLTIHGIKGRTSTAHYQIRAASAGLQQARGERLRRLNRYLRYDLPPGTNTFNLKPEQAPVCLAFVLTAQGERILVHKAYTGERNRGRPFIHILSSYNQEFQARDAISLWRASLWQTFEPELNAQGTLLPTITADVVKKYACSMAPDKSPRVQSQLPFLLQAYLTRKPGQHIYLAAPPDEIACLLQLLTRYLPASLCAGLTFSTYEYDVRTRHECLIVGTCQAPGASRPLRDVLPEECYREGLALNCYTGRQSKLEEHPDVSCFIRDVLESLSAQDAVNMTALLDEFAAEGNADNPQTFLKAYASASQSGKLSRQAMEALLRRPEQAAAQLRQRAVQAALFAACIQDRTWQESAIHPLLRQLAEVSKHNQELARALAVLAQEAMHIAFQAAQIEECNGFLMVLSLLASLSTPEPTSELWHTFYSSLPGQRLDNFIYKYWSIRQALLQLATQIFTTEEGESLRPLLSIRWPQLGPLLSLSLAREWQVIALEELIADPLSTPTASQVQQLRRHYANILASFLQYLENQPHLRDIAQKLRHKLDRGI
ncbi:hypothetical protein EPA93_34415 [Ktedonosporobacter rubrisoli]|uniref:Uncharacterized protein n=1 Tax=Ktedonosporobacter rubrisoli TaxID=2509675 RepID=A0A4P6JZC3_KTERU|nr:hypothetical protein [Ktedonosporobacter rubrisoli]QBD80790.1 hypothetical protein EPA93_34415 [Ktedonosporobacter rubrisoli]